MSVNLNPAGASQFLKEYNWPPGLQQAMLRSLEKLPLRFIILDDSGSMAVSDGCKLLGEGANKKEVGCTRWAEMLINAKFYCGLAHAAGALTEFRLLNNGAPCVVGRQDDNSAGYHHMMGMLNSSSPSGTTPLCRHVTEIIAQIRGMEAQLRANGHKAVIVICTDGEASDGDLAAALAPLHSLPVWLVVQLCTDDGKVVDYWNNIDKQLELDMDILDDLVSEAKEIHEHNKWFTYGEPMHRLRGFGVAIKELDLLDEVALSPDQIRDVCTLIFGGNVEDFPHPDVDAKSFVKMVGEMNKKVDKTWSPIAKKPRHWIEVAEMKSIVGGGCSIM